MNSKKILALGLAAVMLTGSLAGCGSKDNSSEDVPPEESVFSTELVPNDEPGRLEDITGDEAFESTEEYSVNAPVITDLTSYDAIISQLTPGTAYAFADMDSVSDALLVTSGVFDNGDGTMAAIDATIYGFDSNGDIIEYGTVMSDGTAYPLAIYDGMLIFVGNHHVGLEYIDESLGSIITKEDAEEQFDADGNATYYYFSLDDEFEGEVEDDSKLSAMYDKYAEAIVINFTEVE